MTGTHSPYGPSAAHRWMRCPASIKRSAGKPNKSSPAAEEGTLLHGHAEHWLRHGDHGPGWDDLTHEQQQVVAQYINVVILAELETKGTLYVEHRFHLKCHPMFYGTADAVLINTKRGILKVLDLKAGAGVPVEVDYNGRINPQLGYYALGALDLWPEDEPPPDDIEIVVVQPRAGGVKRRKVSMDELVDLKEELLSAAAKAERDDPPAEAGPHCKFCLAAAECPTLKSYSLELARMEFSDDATPPDDMNDMALAQTLERANVLEGWIKAVREEAQARIANGGKVPGWCLAPSHPVRRWKDENLVAKRLADLGMTSIYVEMLVSPAQAEKALKALEWDFDAQMGDLVEKKSSGTRLLREGDNSSAEDDFG
jgi:hypothetical protein